MNVVGLPNFGLFLDTAQCLSTLKGGANPNHEHNVSTSNDRAKIIKGVSLVSVTESNRNKLLWWKSKTNKPMAHIGKNASEVL
jgi:hypothetical protein